MPIFLKKYCLIYRTIVYCLSCLETEAKMTHMVFFVCNFCYYRSPTGNLRQLLGILRKMVIPHQPDSTMNGIRYPNEVSEGAKISSEGVSWRERTMVM